jgi:GTP cyclohydrolase I
MMFLAIQLKRKHSREDNEVGESNDWMMSPGYTIHAPLCEHHLLSLSKAKVKYLWVITVSKGFTNLRGNDNYVLFTLCLTIGE